MCKNHYFGPRSLTRNERRLGRRLRDESGHPAGGTPPAQQNNMGVSESGEQGSSAGNTGQAFDPATFWNQQTPEPDPVTQGANNQGVELGQRMIESINNAQFEDVFTQEALTKMGEGDMSMVNKGIAQMQRNTMTQMLGMMAQVMQSFESHFTDRLEGRINERFESSRTTQQDEQLLKSNFKAFENPAVRPVIQGVYKRAVEHSKGDRTKALELTRAMLAEMGRGGREDFGLSGAGNPDDNMNEGSSRLVQELLALKGK